MKDAKYNIVQEWIKGEINKGTYKSGDKIPSENELMEKFSFSRQTVRLAISNLENQGYLEKVKGSGTYIKLKENSSNKETRAIGVIITYPDSYIFPEIIKGIEKILTNNNYSIMLGITYNKIEKETAILNSMIDKKIDGLIVEGCKTAIPNPNKEIYFKIQKSVPCIFLNACYSGLEIPTISMDDVEGGFIAAKYLIKNGHINIATIFKSDDIQGLKKYEGYMNAIHSSNMQINDLYNIWFTSEDIDTLFILLKQSYRKRLSKCSAIICHNDEIALMLVDFLKEMDIKPFEEFSIISFDNSKISEHLHLTSVNHLKAEFGIKAAESLIKQIKIGEASSVKIKPELIVRDSVKRRSFSNNWENSGIKSFNLIEE